MRIDHCILFFVVTSVSLDAGAENFFKCVDAGGRISYQGQPCPPAQKVDKEMKYGGEASGKGAATQSETMAPKDAFQKSKDSPTITFYYSPAYEPPGVTLSQTESIIKEAAEKWNKGCNVNLAYGGVRKVDAPKQQTPGDGYIIRWDSALEEVGNFGLGAAGVGGVQSGVALNPKSISNPAQLRRVITHELGHVIGIGHIHEDKSSIMSYLSDAQTQFSANPNPSDYLSCNLAMRQNYGIKFDEPKNWKNSEMSTEQASRVLRGEKSGR